MKLPSVYRVFSWRVGRVKENIKKQVGSEHLESSNRIFLSSCFCEHSEQVFTDGCLSNRYVYRWHKGFLEGREEVSEELRSGRPSTTSILENVTSGGFQIQGTFLFSRDKHRAQHVWSHIAKNLKTSPSQCASTYIFSCARYLVNESMQMCQRNRRESPKLLFVSALENSHERSTFQNGSRL